MLYPLKFIPVYKNYIWGGRNLEILGRKLPEGKIAESWEVSCHPDGESIISNGSEKGKSLTSLINEYGYEAIGRSVKVGSNSYWKPGDSFPLLVKLIDANDKLSVQVHPDDIYAQSNEEDKSGKNEMWYIMYAEPGAKLVYGLKPGTTKDMFEQAVKNDCIEEYLNYTEVKAGDSLYIPAGLIHAIGQGIILAEVQQNSNNTYRVYDYNRVDNKGLKRPLHIEKALDVINFDEALNVDATDFTTDAIATTNDSIEDTENTVCKDRPDVRLVSSEHFVIDLIKVTDKIIDVADGSRFFIYIIIDGIGTINYSNNTSVDIKAGETVFIPASMGQFEISGKLKAIKAFVPSIRD